MADIWQAIGVLASTLHIDRMDAIASCIAKLEAPSDLDKCKQAFGPGVHESQMQALQDAWNDYPDLTGTEIASAFRAAGRTASIMGASESIDLVWTGPKTELIPTRNTEQVLLQVIKDAKKSLFIVSYVFYNAQAIVDALNAAIDRGVSSKILLESSTEHGGTVSGDGLLKMRGAVPKAILFRWSSASKALNSKGLSAAVHAKCAVADHQVALITSANLTSAALERNMELGVLMKRGTVPDRLHKHLDALVTTKIIETI